MLFDDGRKSEERELLLKTSNREAPSSVNKVKINKRARVCHYTGGQAWEGW